jgi:hypothetical protein
MCAIRLNWMADLPFDQARAGSNERNPCFPEGVYVGEGSVFVGDIPGYLGRVNLPVTGQVSWMGQ